MPPSSSHTFRNESAVTIDQYLDVFNDSRIFDRIRDDKEISNNMLTLESILGVPSSDNSKFHKKLSA